MRACGVPDRGRAAAAPKTAAASTPVAAMAVARTRRRVIAAEHLRLVATPGIFWLGSFGREVGQCLRKTTRDANPRSRTLLTAPHANWKGRRLHFVGVGGAGMSGLALIAHELGAEVTGSDRADSTYAERLREHGLQ